MHKQGPVGQGGSGECGCSQDDSLGTPKRLVKTWNWGFVSLRPGLERHPTKADVVDEISKVTPPVHGSVQAHRQSPRTPALRFLCTICLKDAGRELPPLLMSERAGEGAGEHSQSGARAVSGHTTGWRGAVARAAQRFCLRRQSDLEPVGLFWATSLASRGAPHRGPGPSKASTQNVRGPPVRGYQQERPSRQREWADVMCRKQVPCHNTARTRTLAGGLRLLSQEFQQPKFML